MPQLHQERAVMVASPFALPIVPPPPAWMRDAPCAEIGTGFTSLDDKEACNFCARSCPIRVKRECLAYGLAQDVPDGNSTTVYGGLRPVELARVKRAMEGKDWRKGVATDKPSTDQGRFYREASDRTVRDALDLLDVTPPKRRKAGPSGAAAADPIAYPCGTPAAYKRHTRRGEPACEACLRAESTYKREYERGGSRVNRPSGVKCGTTSGYKRHLRLDQAPCDACRKANTAYNRDYERRHPRTKATPADA